MGSTKGKAWLRLVIEAVNPANGRGYQNPGSNTEIFTRQTDRYCLPRCQTKNLEWAKFGKRLYKLSQKLRAILPKTKS